jgi:hypothetical protein
VQQAARTHPALAGRDDMEQIAATFTVAEPLLAPGVFSTYPMPWPPGIDPEALG